MHFTNALSFECIGDGNDASNGGLSLSLDTQAENWRLTLIADRDADCILYKQVENGFYERAHCQILC